LHAGEAIRSCMAATFWNCVRHLISLLRTIGTGALFGACLAILGTWNDATETGTKFDQQPFTLLLTVGLSGGAVAGALFRALKPISRRSRTGYYVAWITSAAIPGAFLGVFDSLRGAEWSQVPLAAGLAGGVGFGLAMFAEHIKKNIGDGSEDAH
jgi:hypothetical protein